MSVYRPVHRTFTGSRQFNFQQCVLMAQFSSNLLWRIFFLRQESLKPELLIFLTLLESLTLLVFVILMRSACDSERRE